MGVRARPKNCQKGRKRPVGLERRAGDQTRVRGNRRNNNRPNLEEEKLLVGDRNGKATTRPRVWSRQRARGPARSEKEGGGLEREKEKTEERKEDKRDKNPDGAGKRPKVWGGGW